jgi:predicted DNA-binding transcriptional regulator AlpA
MEPTKSSSTTSAMCDDVRIEALPPYLNLVTLGERVLQLKRTATQILISRPDFPLPIRLGGRHRVWKTTEVLDWVDRQPRLSGRSMPSSLATARRYRDGRLVS